MSRMTERPKWAGTVYLWLVDDQFDGLVENNVPDGWRWTWREWLKDAGLWMLCFTLGHKAVPDQCGIPEHDLCTFCNKPMPCQAERRRR